MIITNDDDYGNPCDESNGNKANIKKWITKNNKSTTSLRGNKNNRNYNINNNHNDINSNNKN